MVSSNNIERLGPEPAKRPARKITAAHAGTHGRARLAGDLFGGRYRPGQSLDLRDIAAEHGLDLELVVKAFEDFQSLGMVTISGRFSAVVLSPNPKEVEEAYEIRAALEELAGRAAARNMKGNTASLQREIDQMRAAFRDSDLETYAEHAANFHRLVIVASGNDLLLRVWNTLAFELRIHAMVYKVSKHIPEFIDSLVPVVDALHKGRGKDAGLLLRSFTETVLAVIKKAEWDSGVFRAIRRDLEGAKDVQQAFFPPRNVSIPCLGSETFYQPAHGLGGDYYDFLPLAGGRWGIAIGDVSGKGIGAALIMASLQASLRAQASLTHSDPSRLIENVNRLVHEFSPPDFFASLFYAEYEPATRILEYVNAGHNAPIVIRSHKGRTKAFHLQSTDVPVGISGRSKFPAAAFQLHEDDLVVAYTDGITEVENRQGEMFGAERLEHLLRSSVTASADQVIDRILSEANSFAEGQPQRDDITLVVMRVQPGCVV